MEGKGFQYQFVIPNKHADKFFNEFVIELKK